MQDERIYLANGWIPGKKEKKKKPGKKGKIWAEICMAACRQGDPLACCLLLACQRKFCPCLGSSTQNPAWLCAAVPGGLWPRGRQECPAWKSTPMRAACQAVPRPPDTTSAPEVLLLPRGWGQVSSIPEFITSWVPNPLRCSLLSYCTLPLASAASRLLQLHGKFRINRTV